MCKNTNNTETENEGLSQDHVIPPSNWPDFPEERMVTESYKEWKEEHKTEKE
ncbi:MAG: hypothetical protein ACQEWL_06550 [Pseudomonadota bacterium]